MLNEPASAVQALAVLRPGTARGTSLPYNRHHVVTW
jgi:hypothetical protein